MCVCVCDIVVVQVCVCDIVAVQVCVCIVTVQVSVWNCSCPGVCALWQETEGERLMTVSLCVEMCTV